MSWVQKEIILQSRKRGFHLITQEVIDQVKEIRQFSIGTAHFFICHTSASLTINENACAEVRLDFESHFNQMVPENAPYYQHRFKGEDDMPAHIKGSILGSSLLVPVTNGSLNLGTWQGLYLCEHRNHGGARKLVVTLHGE